MMAENDKGRWARLFDISLEDELKSIRAPILTKRAINAVLGLCAFGIFALALVAWQRGSEGFSFFAWAVLCALASTLGGGALGLLFGLPGRRQGGVAVATGGHAASAAPGTYEESTSLEQIADWLTKIIVGLTLTQWASWSASFDRLALQITQDLLCPGRGPCGYVPGGVLITAYCLGGFIVAYLWVRRFFMLEMVTRDRAIDDLLRAQQQRETAAKEGRVQAGDPSEGAQVDYSNTILGIIGDGKRNASAAAQAAAGSIKAGADADDPWRGAFGGRNASDRAMLNATVSPQAGDGRFFKVQLVVAGITVDSQRQLAGQKVLLYLHPTFGNEVRVASFGADGRAVLDLFAYGAFTVGAILEDGTPLELNLATLPGAPDQFKLN